MGDIEGLENIVKSPELIKRKRLKKREDKLIRIAIQIRKSVDIVKVELAFLIGFIMGIIL